MITQQTTQFKFCTKDYITTIYPAWGQFLLPENLLANPVIFLPFHTVHGILSARILKWFAIPFSSGPHFVRTLHHDPSVLVALHGMAHSFNELDRLWSMCLDWLVFCDCGFQTVCPLIEKDKRLMEASWWDRLPEGETGSCSDGWGHAQ